MQAWQDDPSRYSIRTLKIRVKDRLASTLTEKAYWVNHALEKKLAIAQRANKKARVRASCAKAVAHGLVRPEVGIPVLLSGEQSMRVFVFGD